MSIATLRPLLKEIIRNLDGHDLKDPTVST